MDIIEIYIMNKVSQTKQDSLSLSFYPLLNLMNFLGVKFLKQDFLIDTAI